MINIVVLPQAQHVQLPQTATGKDLLSTLAFANASQILVMEVNGQLRDLTFALPNNATVTFLTFDDAKGKSAFWHSSAHVLAQTLQHFYPQVKLTIGPAIDNGFYYDVDLGGIALSDSDFEKIEAKFLEFAAQKSEFKMRACSKADALKYYQAQQNPYKIELIEGLTDGDITFCDHADFTDLCRGGHIPHTALIKAVKLTSIAGAYWRGDEKNKMLTRVYGVSFPSKDALKAHLDMLEEAKKRDHRKLGKELELFAFSEKVGAGLPLWLPKGAILRERLQRFLQAKQVAAGYLPVVTPNIGGKQLYVTSGHWEKYGADSFKPITTPREGEEFMLKPMNCPHHCEIYKTAPRSYKELPLRFAEFGTVYRYEQSGELHGLTRVRGFTQDDAHLFCRPDQVKDEFKKVIDLVMNIFKVLDFKNFTAQISLRDQHDRSKYLGSDENWKLAEQSIQEAAAEKNLPTVVAYGEAAFYGPKLDFMVKDALGRSWQLGTIQVDYNLPERFELEYVDADNSRKRPVMIHRAPFGSLDRFIAVLLEHTAGKFPVWLAPVQVVVLPITDKTLEYAQKVSNLLKNSDLRVEVDDRNEKIGKKIRDNETKHIPYLLVVGEQEASGQTLAVRQHGGGDKGSMTVAQFLQHITNEINSALTGE